jgi:LysM repeat protein
LAAALLVLVIFALIGFVALSVLTGNDFGVGRAIGLENQPSLNNTPTPAPLGTPNPLAMVNFKDTALGFNLQYPRSWRKNQSGLRVVLSPSGGGLNPDNLEDAALWVGIPANGMTDPAELLLQTQVQLAPSSQTVDRGPLNIGGETWQSMQVQFNSPTLGPSTATIAAASKNQVGYYLVAVAPAEEWNQIQPVYQNILRNFSFTTQAVLRPTDATPPPTPTPTPTPIFHIVQSGDSLGLISAKFDVSIQAIMDRNGLTENSIIHPGDKIIIPRPRRR